MTYSSALFDGDFDRAARRRAAGEVRPRCSTSSRCPPGARILEIGCGWGGFAETAARAGHHVTGISLSDAQTAYARERLARGRPRRPRRLPRCRTIATCAARFDGVASIEMFEAVGERWWPAYFRTVRDALAPGGRACIQTITIADDRFERYRTQSDFIQQYIFPGGMLASPARFVAEAPAARARARARARLRPRLRRDAEALARRVRRRVARDPRAGLRRALHPLLALLPRLLRRRLRHRDHRCRAVHVRSGLSVAAAGEKRGPLARALGAAGGSEQSRQGGIVIFVRRTVA